MIEQYIQPNMAPVLAKNGVWLVAFLTEVDLRQRWSHHVAYLSICTAF